MVLRQHDAVAAEARAIMQAIRDLQATPELLENARGDPSTVLDRLALSGTARHAVSATLALSVAGVLMTPGITFWSAN
jgi:hypothetical protein